MNKSTLKSYAVKARKEFIKAVRERAHFLGIMADHIEKATSKGDTVFIAGRPHRPEDLKGRDELVNTINKLGFDQVIQSVAYTWFNRFAALRYMEIHGYLDHGLRVLSNPSGENSPEIMERAADVDLLYLDKTEVIDLKLAGNKDAQLYRQLILSQCWTLAEAMPFLFTKKNLEEYVDLLLPDNLLLSDSIVRSMVADIDEDDWQEVEIIGWLYQFFISERKDEVIGKVVKSEDIPAATQLFTPNWIVKYMTQNSLGRLWLETYPESPLKKEMEYYIEPAEQTPEVQAQLEKVRPKELNPEELKVLDPACGSGHILTEAFDLLFQIYNERGYRKRDIPQLILEKNLYGLDIDQRAAQMAGFALIMKAREHDRRIFERGINLNVLEITESNAIDIDELHLGDLQRFDVKELLDTFHDAKTFGSLITVEPYLLDKLSEVKSKLEKLDQSANLHEKKTAESLLHFYHLAAILADKYDAVIANPPFMGSKYLNPSLKKMMKKNFKGFEKDLFASFIVKSTDHTKTNGYLGFMSPFTWMFISSFEKLREEFLTRRTLLSLIRPEYHAFFDSAFVPICTFILRNCSSDQKGDFIDLSKFYGAENQALKTLEAIKNPQCGWRYTASSSDFKKIPGSPIAYWVSDRVREIFQDGTPLGDIAEPKQGLATADNDRFLRLWHEVNIEKVGFGMASSEDAEMSGLKWFPYNKGGDFRKWYGNNEWLVNWENNGFEIKNFTDENGKVLSRPQNTQYYFRESVTWSRIGSSSIGARFSSQGFIFDCNGPSIFSNTSGNHIILGLLCSKLASNMLEIISPTLTFQTGDISKISYTSGDCQTTIENLEQKSKSDWDSFENSWDFAQLPLLTNYSLVDSGKEKTVISHSYTDTNRFTLKAKAIEESYTYYIQHSSEVTAKMKELEEENNRIFIEAYGLQDELTPDVTLEQITLTVNPAYRYKFKTEGTDITDPSQLPEELWDKFRLDTMKELISYAVGCMMGRYSLDKPGLIYAHAGNEGFDPDQYSTFPADDDGIIPVTDREWFDDDATARLRQFIKVAWPESSLDENMIFIADALGQKDNETPQETIRRYISKEFFKDHCKTYKKRPIYWLFTSGKQKAFECLVYLHRYNDQTLSRMRTSYVVPLLSKLSAGKNHLTQDIDEASSSAQQTKLQKKLDNLTKKQKELIDFDEQLRHYADQRISLDLDDGVKVNYTKFGKLLRKI